MHHQKLINFSILISKVKFLYLTDSSHTDLHISGVISADDPRFKKKSPGFNLSDNNLKSFNMLVLTYGPNSSKDSLSL